MLRDLFRRRSSEAREASAENPAVPVSAQSFWQKFGLDELFGASASGVVVTIDSALTVPAVWCAVNFLSGSLAALPLHVYKRQGAGDRVRVRSKLATLLHDAVNDELTSYAWRKSLFDQVLTGGRSFTFIERNAAGAVINLWPLDPGKTTVVRAGGRTRYVLKDGARETAYEAGEIIDLAFMLKADGVGHRGPIAAGADTIGLAIAMTRYGSRFFQNGGVPPFAITGQFVSGPAMQRAAEDLAAAVKRAAKEGRQALVLPAGLEIKPIGVDPKDSQLIEARRFVIEEIARIWQLPPVFLQDLQRATFTNSEQQDLQLVKHTLMRWVRAFEDEVNLKLFGRASTVQFVEMAVDGLLRGDFKARMDGYSQAITHGIMTPNEIRQRENLPADDKGDQLYMQGAMTPLGTPLAPPAAPAAGSDTGGASDDDNA